MRRANKVLFAQWLRFGDGLKMDSYKGDQTPWYHTLYCKSPPWNTLHDSLALNRVCRHEVCLIPLISVEQSIINYSLFELSMDVVMTLEQHDIIYDLGWPVNHLKCNKGRQTTWLHLLLHYWMYEQFCLLSTGASQASHLSLFGRGSDLMASAARKELVCRQIKVGIMPHQQR